jgi:SAM-dependent methyltransferase
METKTAEQARIEWNAVWQSPTQRAIGVGRNFYNRYLKREILPYAGADKRFLEIGCGTASLLCDLAPSFREAVGLDISEAALDGATRRAGTMKVPNARFIQGDCFALPFEDGSFDVVWSQGLHEHFPNYEEILREEYRVCKVGGRVIAGVPYRYSYPTVWYKISRATRCHNLWPWTEQVFFKKGEILEVARRINPEATAHVMSPWGLGILIVKIEKRG